MGTQPTAALVTGAARGIGKATAHRFAADDRFEQVICVDIDDIVKDVTTDLSGATPAVIDVSDHDVVEEFIEDIESDIDVEALVNNAAVANYAWIGDLTPEEWDHTMDVNLKGQYNLIRHLGPRMYDRGRGWIVNVSSGAGQRGSASAGVHYSASKAGIFGLTRGVAKQLAPTIHVNCVVPGLIDTRLASKDDLWSDDERAGFLETIPAGRLGEPDEVARVIEFLSGEGAAYVTGTVVNVDGGAALR